MPKNSLVLYNKSKEDAKKELQEQEKKNTFEEGQLTLLNSQGIKGLDQMSTWSTLKMPSYYGVGITTLVAFNAMYVAFFDSVADCNLPALARNALLNSASTISQFYEVYNYHYEFNEFQKRFIRSIPTNLIASYSNRGNNTEIRHEDIIEVLEKFGEVDIEVTFSQEKIKFTSTNLTRWALACTIGAIALSALSIALHCKNYKYLPDIECIKDAATPLELQIVNVFSASPVINVANQLMPLLRKKHLRLFNAVAKTIKLGFKNNLQAVPPEMLEIFHNYTKADFAKYNTIQLKKLTGIAEQNNGTNEEIENLTRRIEDYKLAEDALEEMQKDELDMKEIIRVLQEKVASLDQEVVDMKVENEQHKEFYANLKTAQNRRKLMVP